MRSSATQCRGRGRRGDTTRRVAARRRDVGGGLQPRAARRATALLHARRDAVSCGDRLLAAPVRGPRRARRVPREHGLRVQGGSGGGGQAAALRARVPLTRRRARPHRHDRHRIQSHRGHGECSIGVPVHLLRVAGIVGDVRFVRREGGRVPDGRVVGGDGGGDVAGDAAASTRKHLPAGARRTGVAARHERSAGAPRPLAVPMRGAEAAVQRRLSRQGGAGPRARMHAVEPARGSERAASAASGVPLRHHRSCRAAGWRATGRCGDGTVARVQHAARCERTRDRARPCARRSHFPDPRKPRPASASRCRAAR